jgi:hypothetical protein
MDPGSVAGVTVCSLRLEAGMTDRRCITKELLTVLDDVLRTNKKAR